MDGVDADETCPPPAKSLWPRINYPGAHGEVREPVFADEGFLFDESSALVHPAGLVVVLDHGERDGADFSLERALEHAIHEGAP